MHKDKAVSQRVILILLVMNLILTAGIIAVMLYNGSSYESAQKYTLYIGLNDKDTYSQKISTAQAQKMVDEICARYADGYTRFSADGGWVDPSGALTEEETLVYTFYGIDEDNLAKIMDETLDALNQNSILVERSRSVYSYYSGKNDESR